MRGVLLGFRPNSSALGTAGSLVTIGFVVAWNFPALATQASFVNKQMLAFEKKKNRLTRQNGVDYSRSSSCGEYLLFSTSMKNVTDGGFFFRRVLIVLLSAVDSFLNIILNILFTSYVCIFYP